MVTGASQIVARCACAGTAAVRLPFSEQPPFVTYNYLAFLSGALAATSPNHINFILNNYIQLSSPSLYSRSHLLSFVPAIGIDNTAGIKMGEVNVRYPASVVECETIIAEGLGKGCYARIVADEFFIPDRSAFGRSHFIHDNMVVGYCPVCRMCWLVGYGTQEEELPSFGVSVCSI